MAWNLKACGVGGGDGGSNPESAPGTGDATKLWESHCQSTFKSVLLTSSPLRQPALNSPVLGV